MGWECLRCAVTGVTAATRRIMGLLEIPPLMPAQALPPPHIAPHILSASENQPLPSVRTYPTGPRMVSTTHLFATSQ